MKNTTIDGLCQMIKEIMNEGNESERDMISSAIVGCYELMKFRKKKPIPITQGKIKKPKPPPNPAGS